MLLTSWSTMYQFLVSTSVCVGFGNSYVYVYLLFPYQFPLQFQIGSVRVSVFASVMCLHLFSIIVSMTFSVQSQFCFVLLCFASADMTLLVRLISPLLSNFWLSRIFLFVFVLFVLQVIWDNMGFQ
ncbi:hypothetical protein HanRHA438_Chr02g0061941 [Helianthus annuus]|nr:hypothetical protein HanRHA438_Chr02g0061941 [Helianthus annuus]